MFWLISIILIVILVVIIFFYKVGDGRKEMPYRLKKYFFSKTEQEFFRELSLALDKEKYTIFPKVRLADFVEVTASKVNHQKYLNSIKAKHIDFVIWNIEESKIALAIELDGKSHQSEKMKESDGFKDNLYNEIELKLVRVLVGTDFRSEIEKIKNSLG